MVGIKGTRMYPRKRELNIYNNIVLKPRQLYISPVFFLFSNFRMFLLNGGKKKEI